MREGVDLTRGGMMLGLALTTCVALACSTEPPGEGATAENGEAVVRTANPDERGLTTEDFPRIKELADGVYSYEQLRSAGEQLFTTVSLFVVTSEGVLVADGQGSVEETERMIAEIGEVTDEPVTHLVIGSDHGDHTGGNAAFPASVTVYAHPTSKANLERTAGSSGSDAAPAHIPTELVEDQRVIQLGEKEIHLLFLGRAHTGGDLVTYLPDEQVLFMSETYLNRVFPAMRSAYPSEWVAMIEEAQALDVETYVPGHGFVDSPVILAEELETYQQAIEQVIAEATRLHDAGYSVDEAVEAADFGELEDWSLSSSQAPTAVRRVYMELNNELPAD